MNAQHLKFYEVRRDRKYTRKYGLDWKWPVNFSMTFPFKSCPNFYELFEIVLWRVMQYSIRSSNDQIGELDKQLEHFLFTFRQN